MNEFNPYTLTLLSACLSVLINIPWGLFWGYVLARKQFPGKVIVHTILYMPLVLPPVLTGYFLLKLFSPEVLNWQILFSYQSVVLAAAVVASPFMIQFVKQAFEEVDPKLEKAAANLGASFLRVLWTITLPLAWRGIVAGMCVCFAKSVGEFGATMMVAGNIPGKTQTIPLAIYHAVYLGHEQQLWPLIVGALLFSYGALWLSYKVTHHD